MGAWGIGLYQNDVSDEVRTTYRQLLAQGQSDEEAVNKLLGAFSSEIDDSDDGPLFWMAVADTQWKLGRLDDSIKEKALKAIAEEDTEEIFGELGKAAVRRRKAVLEELKNELLSEQPERKKMRIIKPFVNDWKIGDIYALPIRNPVLEEYGFAGQYLLYHKTGEYMWDGFSCPHHVDAVVRIKITANGRLPNDLDEFNDLEFVQFCLYSGEPEYTADLHASSKRQFPKELMYWGNYREIKLPDNEYLSGSPQMLIAKQMGIFDVYNYLRYNKRMPKAQLEACWKRLYF